MNNVEINNRMVQQTAREANEQGTSVYIINPTPIVLAMVVIFLIMFIFCCPIFSVYQNGGVLYEEEYNYGTYTFPPLQVAEYDEEGTFLGWREEGEPREVETKGFSRIMLDEDAEIPDQTLAQVIYRWATDSTRLESERIKRVGLTL